MPDRRGQCDTCGLRFRPRRDGTVPGHPGRPAAEALHGECPGSGQPARPLRFDSRGRPERGECLEYLYSPAAAGLGEAIPSVAIETDSDPAQVLRGWLGAYHGRDHKEPGHG